MNYKIIANEEELLKFIHWLPELEEGEKYYLALFSRKKYCETLIQSSDKTQLKRFVTEKDRFYNRLRQLEIPVGAWKLKNGEDVPQESLALYITINPRSMKKATEMMGKKCWDLMSRGNYNVHAEALSCIQKSKSRTCFIDFDIDTKEIDLDLQWLNEEIGEANYEILETRGGYHIMVNPTQASAFRQEKFGDKNWHVKIQKKYPVDQSGDQLVPVPGSYQGGFVPRFIKKTLSVEI
ncbi:hypothetical protein [Aureivirga sp. CE67]|uniref:hypothetical protein n=1 Tax=Aureivirga sp. CE67 TaxID=1788983 RepID=UPI0018CA1950|nr:hypothetical protein [Aureivirga sp. CE67]